MVAGETFARFRLSTTGELDSTGVATDGEVEDYAVTIVQSGDFTDAVVDTPEDGGELTVEIVNGSIIVRRSEDVLLDTPLANLETLTINGSDATDDTLALDFTNGTPLPSGGLFFNGGSGGDDIITVTGGSVVTATYTFENLTDGTINYLIGGQTFTIDYTGLEPVIDNLEAVNRIFDFTGGAELIELIDTNGADGMMTITSTLGESIEFVNPTGSLTINGGSGNDTITSLDAGLTVRTNIHGGDGDDTIALGNGIVVGNVTGGAGIDLLDYSAFTTSVTVNLAAGTATNTSSVATIENVTGGSGADFLDGGVGNDTLKSGAGDDELSGGAGIDSIDGGIGTDCLIEVVTGNITITDTKITGLGSDKILNVECFEFSGDDRNNLLDASKYTLGSVVLRGNGGNDTLLGGSRNDTLDGGEGFDIIKQSASVNQTITGDSATGAETDSLVSIEGAQLISLGRTGLRLDASGFFGKAALDGTAGNDTLLGGGGVSTLNGNAGHDLIVVGSAVESLTGGAGNDTLIGNAGSDVLRGGEGSDSLLGNSGDDRIFGDAGGDRMFGGTGQDLMDGGAGNDTMLGEAGHDTIKGGTGNDGMSGGAGDDFMDGESGDDTLLGGSGSDTLRTAAGRDRALGEEGNDRIESLSDDTISGGAGDNIFIGPHAKIDEAFVFDFSKLLV